MFDFLKKKNTLTSIVKVNDEDEQRTDNGASKIGAGYATANSAYQSTQQAAKTFAKPDTYTGNRALYDSGEAKMLAKKELFKSGKVVKDPYTGEKLVLTRKEAKMMYGDKWADHLAESDHVVSLEKVYEHTKDNVWNTTDDIKSAANSKDNIAVVSRKFNNYKRSKNNSDLVNNEEALNKKDIKLTPKGKEQAIRDEELAKKSIDEQLRKSTRHNIAQTGHKAGVAGATNAGVTSLTMSGIMNMVSVAKGEKSGEEAIADTVKDSGKAAVTGYAMASGLTVGLHTMGNSSSKFIRGLAKNNVPGKVITAVMVTGDTLIKWGNGEISTQECMIELGDKGLNMVTMGYSMAVGQAIIPIPIVGGAVGALVGSMLTSTYYNNLINVLQTRQLEYEERKRIIEECHVVAEQTKAFRMELEAFIQSYFQEYRECFDSALSSMRFSFQAGDADGMIAGANEITRKLGGRVNYETVEEFKHFLDDDSTDVL